MGLTSKQKLMMAVLIFGTFVTVLNQTVVTPALPSVMVEMGRGRLHGPVAHHRASRW